MSDVFEWKIYIYGVDEFDFRGSREDAIKERIQKSEEHNSIGIMWKADRKNKEDVLAFEISNFLRKQWFQELAYNMNGAVEAYKNWKEEQAHDN